MKHIFLPIAALAILSACQEAKEQPVEETLTVDTDSETQDQYIANYVGKYALGDGCQDDQPIIALEADKLHWGETSCSIDQISMNAEGLLQVTANQCTAEGEAQDDRTYTIEAAGMMGVEFVSDNESTIAKRCEAFEAG